MVAGLLAGSGYFMGERLWPARGANPKGFYEDREVNLVNEALLAPLLARKLPGILGRLQPRRRGRLQRWLALLPDEAEVAARPRLGSRIARLAARRPFCFKDPRFCYTLPAWRPHLGGGGFVCVFRDPERTVRSIARELETARYLRTLRLDAAEIAAVWNAMYRRVLDQHRHEGDWLFVHYDQVISGSAPIAIEAFLDVRADRTFVEKRLQRSASSPLGLSPEVRATYEELCDRAGCSARACS